MTSLTEEQFRMEARGYYYAAEAGDRREAKKLEQILSGICPCCGKQFSNYEKLKPMIERTRAMIEEMRVSP